MAGWEADIKDARNGVRARLPSGFPIIIFQPCKHRTQPGWEGLYAPTKTRCRPVGAQSPSHIPESLMPAGSAVWGVAMDRVAVGPAKGCPSSAQSPDYLSGNCRLDRG